jgi:protocatechuate 3,4-dioxygenase beta subunit
VPLTTTTTLAPTPTTGALGTVFTLTVTVIDQNSDPVTGGQVAFYNAHNCWAPFSS